MDTQSPDVCSSFARYPEDGQVSVVVEFNEFARVDGSNSELTLDGGDERGSLEECSSEGFESSCEGFLSGQTSMQSNDADVLLSCWAGRKESTVRKQNIRVSTEGGRKSYLLIVVI